MDINRNSQIIMNSDLLRKIVYCIEKGIGDDLQQYLKENHKETNNAVRFLKGDNINENLRNHVVKDDIDLISFQRRGGWFGRIIIDRKEHITYSIMTEETLSDVLKKKNRKSPHYLQSVLCVENKDCIAKEKQMTLEDFGIIIFDTGILEQDFEKISQGMINIKEDYKHYIIAYKAKNGEIQDIKLKFLEKDFNIVDEKSLKQYIKPDFAQLTDVESTKDTNEEKKIDKKGLVAIKSGIKPKLREIEKKA